MEVDSNHQNHQILKPTLLIEASKTQAPAFLKHSSNENLSFTQTILL